MSYVTNYLTCIAIAPGSLITSLNYFEDKKSRQNIVSVCFVYGFRIIVLEGYMTNRCLSLQYFAVGLCH